MASKEKDRPLVADLFGKGHKVLAHSLDLTFLSTSTTFLLTIALTFF